MPLNYHSGDLFDLIVGQDNVLIPHIVNNINKWGAGFVVPLGKRFPCVRTRFLATYDMNLGSVDYVVSEYNVIANMYAQRGIRNKGNQHPIDYDALTACMINIRKYINTVNAVACDMNDLYVDKIIAPAFGSGLAGGDWTKIESLICDIWCDLTVTVCELRC